MPSRTSTLSAVFRDVAVSTSTVQAGSDHAQLAALAVKHAIDGRGVAHLVLPDEVQVQVQVQVQGSDVPASGPEGRFTTRLVGRIEPRQLEPATVDRLLDAFRDWKGP